MPTNIYILQLEDECWYVGKTGGDVEKRIQAHKYGSGSVWTKLHRPVQVHKTFLNVSPFDEDKYTKEYMATYGIDKVRGGTYVLPNLQPEQKALIQKELWGAQDRCFVCGGNHFVYKCTQTPPTSNDRLFTKICSSIYQWILRCLEPPST